MSEEHVKAMSEVSEAAAAKQDIPVDPIALADDELDTVAGGTTINTSTSNIKQPGITGVGLTTSTDYPSCKK